MPYAPGKLRVEGVRGGRVVAKQEIETASAATKLRLTADHNAIAAEGEDLAFITVKAVDAQGRLQCEANQQVHLTIEGPGRIADLGNGDGKNTASYQGDTLTLFNGRALVIVRSSRKAGGSKWPAHRRAWPMLLSRSNRTRRKLRAKSNESPRKAAPKDSRTKRLIE